MIWLDANANGIQDTGEIGLADITINLFDTNQTLIDTTTSDSSALYQFNNLTLGDYYLELVIPDDYIVSHQHQGDDTTLDSDINPLTGQTTTFTPTINDNLDWDAGLYQLSSISGQVWSDINSDGIQQNTEDKLSGWAVFIDSNQDGVLNQGELSALTDEAGRYQFSGLKPGEYSIAQVLATNYEQAYPISSTNPSSD